VRRVYPGVFGRCDRLGPRKGQEIDAHACTKQTAFRHLSTTQRNPLKYTYALTISGFNSAWQRDKRSPLYRPDWRHLIIAQANANMSRALHKMDAAGYTPVAVHKDAVYLLSDEPDPVKACPPSVTLGTGLGHFKVQDAAIPLERVLPAFDGTHGGGVGTLLRLLKPLRAGATARTAVGATSHV